MKVKLIKEATYELNEKKNTQIPFDVFAKMTSVDLSAANDENLPKVRIFENIDEFKQVENFNQYDTNKDVFVLKSGQICVFLKETENDVKIEDVSKENATTDTKENTGEKA